MVSYLFDDEKCNAITSKQYTDKWIRWQYNQIVEYDHWSVYSYADGPFGHSKFPAISRQQEAGEWVTR